MLELCLDLQKASEFGDSFTIQLQNVPTADLIACCDSIVQHHTDTSVYLGFLEPGWMLSPEHQTRMRPLFRKFRVGFLCVHLESLPYSWKNEITKVIR